MDERIIVSPRNKVFANESLTFQGVATDSDLTTKIVRNMAQSYSVMRRGDAEENPQYKQPIPYVVVRRGNEVFTYKRLTGGGEKRLHNQVSLGVGGHVNDIEELDFYGIVSESLKRELNEELVIDTNKLTLYTVGLINDDENEVGKVHIGMLVIGHLEEVSEVSVRETDQLEGEWISIDELKKLEVYETLETWSQFVVDIL
jgi:predicted NUDIX family phosphoesterase